MVLQIFYTGPLSNGNLEKFIKPTTTARDNKITVYWETAMLCLLPKELDIDNNSQNQADYNDGNVLLKPRLECQLARPPLEVA